MSGYLRLPPNILSSMCGAGDRAERDLWRRAHISKRMAQLRAILDSVEDHVARAAGLRQNFAALTEVQRHDPGAVADLLSGPQAGAWAAACLRLVARHGSGNGRGGNAALCRHLAHLGAVAAAAALACDVRVRVRVPVRSGAVHFPATGRADLAGSGDRQLVDCVTGSAGVLLDGREPAAWHPVRILDVAAAGVSLRVRIDDVDPYWRAFGMPVTELTDQEVATWHGRLEQAWRLLADRHPHRLATLTATVRCLVPVRQAGRQSGVSASSADAPGAIALTEPANARRLAATLIHESQHYRLASLHDLRPVFAQTTHRFYSPWRNDPRAVSGVTHGLMAFAGVADFWLRERTGPAGELEYARHVRQLHAARREITGATDLTPLGVALVDALGDAIDALPLDTGSADVRRIADDLVTEHRAGWRLRNAVPRDREVLETTAAWARGELPDRAMTGPGEVGRAEPGGDNPLTRVAMAWLENEPDLRALAAEPRSLDERVPGAVPSDLSLMAGDYDAARAHALARIAQGSADHRTWATLVVCHHRACAAPQRSALVRRPELIRAAFLRGRRDDGLGPLLALMSRYEAGTSTSDSMRL